ncbi:MAG: ABC-F family ATP-binding cassette domain-containing protein [Saprospiraceae bacterium]|nr:ABC-F family ATP-binding cassette domain-containing protein [Saprospiraceae bacterium]
MNYLTLENVTKTYGDKVLFKDLALQISKGQKVALVAKNGTGKTTLLRVIAGLESGEGETCKIQIKRDIKIGSLEQAPDFLPDQTILEAAFDSDNPLIQAIIQYEDALLKPNDGDAMQAALNRMDDLKAWDFEAKIKEILTRFNIARFDQKIETLSGGQKKRLALAKLILEEPDFLILDEPTNHLDLDMIEWLEEYLQRANLTLFLVTHDRYFLERVCNTIVELERGILYKYSGNYSDFLEKKALRHDNETIELDKSRKLMRKELEWIRRMPKARGTKAKSRVDAFDTIKEKATKNIQQQEIQIDLKGQRLGKKILEAHNVGKSFGDLKIVEGFDYKFKKGERVGIVGPNGVGKSTFLNILTALIRPDTGKVVVGGNTVFGFYTQDGIRLKDDKRVIDVIRDIAEYIPLEKGQKLTAPQLLERFLFDRKQQQVYVSQLSGGEKRRLYLLTILMENPNFLILDEPTNDLDIVTLNVLEEFLLDFPGCILVVSHDRYFLDKLVDHLFIMQGDGRIKDFNGDYTEYRQEQKLWDREQRKQERIEGKKLKEEAEANKPKVGLTQEQKKEIKRLERSISRLEERKKEVTAKFNNMDLSPADIEKYGKELNEINQEIEEKEMLWMELAEQA